MTTHPTDPTVSIAPGQMETSRKALHDEVVPRVSKAPGLVKGYWTVTPDAQRGLSLVVFRTREDAEHALSMVRNAAPPPGVTFADIEVREVVAES